MKLRIGSRGSQLALWQSRHIATLLGQAGHEVSIEIVKTTGDRLQEITFAQVGSKGMFTKEIEDALAASRVDLAVHSLKDLPTELPAGFALAATPPRVDPRDVFVSVRYERLADLPEGARIGTSSQRRRAQLKALRPDLEAVEFRGNVDTRLRKLVEGQVEAILLAAAGLDRLEKTEWVRERLEPERMFALAVAGFWASLQSEDQALSGLLPWNDSKSYYVDGLRLLIDGQPDSLIINIIDSNGNTVYSTGLAPLKSGSITIK